MRDVPTPDDDRYELELVDGIAMEDGTYGAGTYGERTYGAVGAEPLSTRIFLAVPWITQIEE